MSRIFQQRPAEPSKSPGSAGREKQERKRAFLPPTSFALHRDPPPNNGAGCFAAGRDLPYQPKLRINAPNDRFEQEADRIADMATNNARQPVALSTGRTQVQTRTEGGKGAATTPPSVEQGIQSPAQPLHAETREQMEGKIGAGFDGIRIHTGAAAAAAADDINARAFTIGRDIVFGSNEYAPGTREGNRLIAHELAHVVQQGATPAMVQREEKDKDDEKKVPVTIVAGIASIDLPLGPYNDPFRITVNSRSEKSALIGITNLGKFSPSESKGFLMEFAQPVYHSDATHSGNSLIASGDMGVIASSSDRIELDLTGDRIADIIISDEVNRENSTDRKHYHTVRLQGPGIKEQTFYFTAIDGFVPARIGDFNPSPFDRRFDRGKGYETKDDYYARSDSLASGSLPGLEGQGTYDQVIEAHQRAMLQSRYEASRKGLITKRTYDAWGALSLTIMTMARRIRTNQPVEIDAAATEQLAAQAKEFFEAFSAETRNEFKKVKGRASVEKNEYTDEARTDILVTLVTGAGPALEGQIREKQWAQALESYQTVVYGLDKWIARKLSEQKTPEAAAETAEQSRKHLYLGNRIKGLETLEGKKAKRIIAIFHPDKRFDRNIGYAAEIPLDLYYWREGNEWHLVNMLNPQDPTNYTEPVNATDDTNGLPQRLIHKLNDSRRLPEGIIHYRVPGEYSGQLDVVDELTWQDFFTYASYTLGALGLLLTAIPSGGVSIVAYTALAGSALAGATAAGIDIYERASEGSLDVATAILDIAQIVSSLAGIAAMGAGRFEMIARTAARKGTPLTGLMARAARGADMLYVPLRLTQMGADALSLAVFTGQTAKQLDAIEYGPGTDQEKARDKGLLLMQLAFTGGVFLLSLKGDLPELNRSDRVVLQQVGDTYVAAVGTRQTMVHSTTPGQPVTEYLNIQVRLPRQMQIDYLTTNVQGLTSEQADFLIQKIVEERGGSLIFGGSRVRGNAQTNAAGNVTSDIDLGFSGISRNQFTRVRNAFNERFGSDAFPNGMIEHNFIFPGSESQSMPDIVTPEEFFLRSGVRSETDPNHPSEVYSPSAYIKIQPDGMVEFGRP